MQHSYFVQPHEDLSLQSAIHPLHTRWLFALLAHLDRRLSGEEIAELRALARTCITMLRNFRSMRARSMDLTGNHDIQQEAGAWMIITIIAGVWGQRDLWDEAQLRASTGAGTAGN